MGNFDYGKCKKFGTHPDNETYKIIGYKWAYSDTDYTDREYTAKGTVNTEKLSNNLQRTHNRLYEIASCNPWTMFVTFTFDKKKIDRNSLNAVNTALSQFLRNIGKKYGRKITYLLVPELHKDKKAWHLHGLLYGLPISALKEFTDTKGTPVKVRKMLQDGRHIYNWLDFAKRFGYCTLEPIKSTEAITKYITKYITKDLERMVTDLNAHMFYASKGLKQAPVIAEGTLSKALKPIPDENGEDRTYFENDYIRAKITKSANLALSYFDFGEIPTLHERKTVMEFLEECYLLNISHSGLKA